MRCIISFLLTFTVLVANARQISQKEARSIASEFFNSGPMSVVNNGPHRVVQTSRTGESVTDSQPYYIFNAADNAGFVIISGDTRAKKILGYSDKGSFNPDNIPPQLMALMRQYAKVLESIPDSQSQDETWGSDAMTVSEDGVLLETANWGQGYPYNAQCPQIDGVQAPTGCVATAMAIVMKFHNWPERGRSSHIFVEDNIDKQLDFTQFSFNYELMPSEVSASLQETSKIALSELFLATGRSVNMDYGSQESGAYFEIVAHQLQEKFSYSPTCEFVMGEDYSREEWIDIVKNELKNGRPVLYSGISEIRDKHAFVCDGYKDDYFHVNWGWDGNENGYFDLSGILYSLNPSMVINIYPDKTGKTYARPYLCKDGIYTLFQGADFINVSVPNIQTGIKFDISSPTIHTPYRYSGQLGFALVDKTGTIKEVFATHYIDGSGFQIYNPYMDGKDFICYNTSISEEIVEGDVIQLVAKELPDSDWKLILGCSKISSSISPNDCNNKMTTIHVDCDPKISLTLWEDPMSTPSPIDENTVYKLFGCHEQCRFSINDKSDGYAQVVVSGNVAYGDKETYVCNKEQDGTFAFKLVDDEYYISATFYEYADPLTINIETPGTLKDKIDSELAHKLSDLTISGNLNAFDIWYIRDNMRGLRYLNMESVKIMGVSTPNININNFDVNSYQDEDMMPDWGISGLSLLEEVILPKELKKLSDNSLGGLGIRKIVLPATIEDFGFNNFFVCQNLTIVENLNPNPVPIRDCNFTGTLCPANGALIVPESSVEEYRKSPIWSDFKKIYPCGTILPEKIMVEETNINLTIGESVKLPTVSFYPADATIKDLMLTDYDENIVSFNDGLISAVGIGSTTACLKSEFSSNIIVLNINVGRKLVSDIILNETEITLNEGQTAQLSATVFPELADNGTLRWTSTNEAVATVDQNGLVTAILQGVAIVRVKATDGSGVYAECSVEVTEYSGISDVNADGISISTEPLIATVYGANEDKIIRLYDMSGKMLYIGNGPRVKVAQSGVYLLVVGNKILKIKL